MSFQRLLLSDGIKYKMDNMNINSNEHSIDSDRHEELMSIYSGFWNLPPYLFSNKYLVYLICKEF